MGIVLFIFACLLLDILCGDDFLIAALVFVGVLVAFVFIGEIFINVPVFIGKLSSAIVENRIATLLIIVAILFICLLVCVINAINVMENAEIEEKTPYSITAVKNVHNEKERESLKSFIKNENFMLGVESELSYCLKISRARRVLLKKKDGELAKRIEELAQMREENNRMIWNKDLSVNQMKVQSLFRMIPFPCSKTENLLQKYDSFASIYLSEDGKGQLILMTSCCVLYNNMKKKFKCVNYQDLALHKSYDIEVSNIAEEDDEFAGYRWQHARVDGGPDRRYKNNASKRLVYRGTVKIQVEGITVLLTFANRPKATEFEEKFLAFVKSAYSNASNENVMCN